MSADRQGIYAEIDIERAYQQKQWGDKFDDRNTTSDWLAKIVAYLGKAYTHPADLKIYRKMLVKVAAIAVAAIEQADRLNAALPGRHFD